MPRCPPLVTPPLHGAYIPSQCRTDVRGQPARSVCNIVCDIGYNHHPEYRPLACMADGTWFNNITKCFRKRRYVQH